MSFAPVRCWLRLWFHADRGESAAVHGCLL